MILDNGYDPDVRVYKEAKYLRKKDVDVDILCWDRDKESQRSQEEYIDGIHIIRFNIPSQYGSGKKQVFAYLKFLKSCSKYLKCNRCDYLHCHDLNDGIIGMIIHGNTPYVFDMHEYYEKSTPNKNSLRHKLVEKVIKNSHFSLYDNDLYLSNEYSSIHNKLIPLKNYPDRDLIQYMEKPASKVFRIGYHGYVRNQVKQFETLFEAIKGMDDVRVDIHGLGNDLETLKSMQSNYDNVFVHGAFDGTKELSSLYGKTDVLYCGYDPGDPNMQGPKDLVKYFEAILTGTPMIATESLGVGERVKVNAYGLSVDTDDSQAVKEAIIRLKTDKEFWQRCSQKELSEACKYDWNEAVKILDKVYSL